MQISEFLNPKSMLTPGIAGSMIMLITNALWLEFMLPQKWLALGLSFLIVIPSIAKYPATFFERIIFFIFNGLIIFSLAISTNAVGKNIIPDDQNKKYPSYKLNVTRMSEGNILTENSTSKRNFFDSWF